MSVVLSSAIQSSGSVEGVSLTYPRLGVLRVSGTVSASTEATDYPASRADTPHTYGGWQPTAVPATWEIDLGSAEDVNYCCVAGHDLASNSATIQPQYWDGAAWQDATASETPSDDEPILFLFDTTSASKWRVRVTAAVATIAVIKFGMVTAVSRGVQPSFAPAVWNPENEYTNQVSEGGQILGRLKRRRGRAQDIRLNNVTTAWAEANWPTLRAALEDEGVIFAWAPNDHATHVIYGMTERDPTIEYPQSGLYVNLRIRLRGR